MINLPHLTLGGEYLSFDPKLFDHSQMVCLESGMELLSVAQTLSVKGENSETQMELNYQMERMHLFTGTGKGLFEEHNRPGLSTSETKSMF